MHVYCGLCVSHSLFPPSSSLRPSFFLLDSWRFCCSVGSSSLLTLRKGGCTLFLLFHPFLPSNLSPLSLSSLSSPASPSLSIQSIPSRYSILFYTRLVLSSISLLGLSLFVPVPLPSSPPFIIPPLILTPLLLRLRLRLHSHTNRFSTCPTLSSTRQKEEGKNTTKYTYVNDASLPTPSLLSSFPPSLPTPSSPTPPPQSSPH